MPTQISLPAVGQRMIRTGPDMFTQHNRQSNCRARRVLIRKGDTVVVRQHVDLPETQDFLGYRGIVLQLDHKRGPKLTCPAELIEKNYKLIIPLCDELVNALNGMVDTYVGLVNSGDAGNWDAEKVPEVIAARAALLAARKGGAS